MITTEEKDLLIKIVNTLIELPKETLEPLEKKQSESFMKILKLLFNIEYKRIGVRILKKELEDEKLIELYEDLKNQKFYFKQKINANDYYRNLTPEKKQQVKNKIKKYSKVYYQENKEYILEKKKKYYQNKINKN